ncbi:MAG: NAD-dependent epimerase/dehydratase family protein [Nitrospirae bacterium]|nr:NAD-dependent epimerase/dehydratase family protein [Nitrospirota bacterium]
MTALSGKTIFLTGGAGFIGAELAGRLLDHNRLIVYDTLGRNSIRTKTFFPHANLKLIEGTVLDAASLHRSMEGADIVVHLAAVAGIDTVLKSPTQTMRVNLLGTSFVLDAARELGVRDRVVIFSTSEVFGTYAYRVSESDTTTSGAVGEARWIYAVSKLAGEHMAFAAFKEFALPVVIVRPFNVYGPGQIGEGAVHVFVKRAIAGEDLEIHGDGDQIRSWVYIDDMVDALLLLLQHPSAVGESFNIGNPRGTVTINTLAEMVVSLAESRSRIVHAPRRHADVELRIPSIEKARQMLGFQPKVDLKDGLLKTIRWYREQRDGN